MKAWLSLLSNAKKDTYPVRIVTRTIDVLEGREESLVYPTSAK
jgi:hypothetical protein